MSRLEPRAWAIFGKNGHIRLWSTDSDPVRKLAEEEGLPLVPLYAIPDGYGLYPVAPQWDASGWPLTLAAAVEDADGWLELIERRHDQGRGPWRFADESSLERLRNCRRALRQLMTPCDMQEIKDGADVGETWRDQQ